MEKSRKNKKKRTQQKKTDSPAWSIFCDPSLDGPENMFEWCGWGGVIRRIRKHTGMDQTDFGRLIRGYARNQISRYEKEEAEPPIDFWVKIQDMFGINLNWAFTGKGDPCLANFKDTPDTERFYKWTAYLADKESFFIDFKG